MKNKFLGKLILSGAALAACATTLVTSTYAWYTSNTEVTANQISAGTNSAADNSSLYIAAAQTYSDKKVITSFSNYQNEVTPVFVNSAPTLEPVFYNGTDKSFKKMESTSSDGYTQVGEDAQYNADTIYYLKNGDIYSRQIVNVDTFATLKANLYTRKPDVVTYAKESTADYVEYVLRFRTANPGTETSVYVSDFKIASSGESAQTALAYGAGTGIDKAGTYDVDLLKALKMKITATPATNEDLSLETTNETPYSGTAEENIYGLESFAQKKDSNIAALGANAIGYYNTVLGKNIVTPTADYNVGTEIVADGTNIVLFKIPATGYVEVRFSFYLDGWDTYCYDVCRKQTFNVQMNFSTSSSESKLKTANDAVE